MSTKPLTLEGLVEPASGSSGEAVRELRRQNQRLDEELRSVRNELGQLKAEKENLERSVRALRNQLSPLHRALRAVFGEIELAIGEEQVVLGGAPASAVAASGGEDPRWQSFKQSFPGASARIIDALLAHRELTITQLSTVLKAHYSTVKNACLVLTKAGAISKDGTGGAYRLKV